MTKRFHKHKLLLDENFPVRSYFPNLNQSFDVKHLTADLNLSSLADDKIYKFAQKEERIIITYNIKDFAPLVENDITQEINSPVKHSKNNLVRMKFQF